MAKSIETRIEQLEKKSGVGMPIVVLLMSGESEEAVFQRAKAAALAASNGNVILINELDSRL